MKAIIIFFLLLLLGGCQRSSGELLQGYIDAEYTMLSSTLSGRLEKLYVERGQTVTEGQLLFDLDPEPEASQLRKAVSDLQSEKDKLKDVMSGQRSTVLGGIIAQREQAQADLDLAQVNFNRTAQLFSKGVVSRSTYDQSLATLKANQQRVNQFEQNLKEAELGERQFRILQQAETVRAAEASVLEAKWRLAQKSTIAPESGYIFDTFFNIGEQIAANQPVVSLLAPRYVHLIFYVPEPIRARLKINAIVRFTCDSCKESYEATVYYISPQAEYTPPVIFSRESRAKLVFRVQARLTIDVAKKVLPGQPVDVYFYERKPSHFYILGHYLWQLLRR